MCIYALFDRVLVHGQEGAVTFLGSQSRPAALLGLGHNLSSSRGSAGPPEAFPGQLQGWESPWQKGRGIPSSWSPWPRGDKFSSNMGHRCCLGSWEAPTGKPSLLTGSPSGHLEQLERLTIHYQSLNPISVQNYGLGRALGFGGRKSAPQGPFMPSLQEKRPSLEATALPSPGDHMGA